jgi:hypothetical protein
MTEIRASDNQSFMWLKVSNCSKIDIQYKVEDKLANNVVVGLANEFYKHIPWSLNGASDALGMEMYGLVAVTKGKICVNSCTII